MVRSGSAGRGDQVRRGGRGRAGGRGGEEGLAAIGPNPRFHLDQLTSGFIGENKTKKTAGVRGQDMMETESLVKADSKTLYTGG